jgi:hypothetical protein
MTVWRIRRSPLSCSETSMERIVPEKIASADHAA